MARPRLKLALALALSVASGVAVELDKFYDGGNADGRAGLAAATVLGVLSLGRWLPAVVSLHSPGRRLGVFLIADLLLIAFVAVEFAESSSSLTYAVAAAGAVSGAIAVFWWLPQWQAQRWPKTIVDKDRVEMEDKARATVAQLLSGLGLLATVAITLYSVNGARVAAERSLRATEREQSAARFSRAIDQLVARAGSRPATVVRLGAIYALGQYALHAVPSKDLSWSDISSDESVQTRRTTATVLAAYVRTTAPVRRRASSAPPPAVPPACDSRRGRNVGDTSRSARLAPDVAAAVAVLGQLYSRETILDELDPQLYLPTLDLSATDLRGADLRNFDLTDANFSGGTLGGANLESAVVYHEDVNIGPNLDGVDLRNACLKDVPGLAEATTARTRVEGAVICTEEGRPIKRWLKRGAICPQ